MNFEYFFKYCFQKYIEEHGTRSYYDTVAISLENIFIFRTKDTIDTASKEDINVNLIKDYHFGLVSEHMERCLNEIRSGGSGLAGEKYADLISSNRYILDLRPSAILEKIKNGTLNPESTYHFNFSIEISDVLYLLLNKEMNAAAVYLQTTEFNDIYNHFKTHKDTVFSLIIERYMNLETYIESLASNAADLLLFLCNEKIANYLSYCEFVITKSKNMKSIYNDATFFVNSDEAVKRFVVAYNVLMTFLKIYPTSVTNRGIVTINSGLNINKIKEVLMSMLIMKNLESNVLYIFNSQYSYIYDNSNDVSTTLLRYLHSVVLSRPNAYQALTIFNDIETKKFDLTTTHIFKKHQVDVDQAREIIVENFRTAELGEHETFLEMMDLIIYEAQDAYNKTQDEAEEGKTEAKTGHLERMPANVKGGLYEVKYKLKKFSIDRKKKKYEYLLNEISKDLYLVESKANELTSATEKNNLIREIHSMKAEMLHIKSKAKEMKDDELLDIIEEKVQLADDLVRAVNSRNIRQERKGISFKLERDMTTDLRKMNDTPDKFYNKDHYDGYDDENTMNVRLR